LLPEKAKPKVLQGSKNVGGAKYRRGRSPNGVLRNPGAAEWRRNANRLLGAVIFLY